MKKRFVLSLFALFATQAMAAVNINSAGVAELDAVKGITPKQAQAIVDYRSQHGPFTSLDELRKVKGFGEKSVAKVKAQLTVDARETAKSGER